MLRQWVVKSGPFSKLQLYAETMGGQKPLQSLPQAFQKLPPTVFNGQTWARLQIAEIIQGSVPEIQLFSYFFENFFKTSHVC